MRIASAVALERDAASRPLLGLTLPHVYGKLDVYAARF